MLDRNSRFISILSTHRSFRRQTNLYFFPNLLYSLQFLHRRQSKTLFNISLILQNQCIRKLIQTNLLQFLTKQNLTFSSLFQIFTLLLQFLNITYMSLRLSRRFRLPNRFQIIRNQLKR